MRLQHRQRYSELGVLRARQALAHPDWNEYCQSSRNEPDPTSPLAVIYWKYERTLARCQNQIFTKKRPLPVPSSSVFLQVTL